MDRSTKVTMGQRIANIRRHRGMTQQHLADVIGATRHVIFHLEHGHTRIDIEQAERIAAALHCAVEHLRAPPDAPLPRQRLRRRGFRASWAEVRAVAGCRPGAR